MKYKTERAMALHNTAIAAIENESFLSSVVLRFQAETARTMDGINNAIKNGDHAPRRMPKSSRGCS
jgi:hypothetical protein